MNYFYLALGIFIGYILFKKFIISRANFQELINKEGAIVIDVRTPQEYDDGHILNSKNIPLGVLSQRLDALKAQNVPVICCCASGMRSGQACNILSKAGIKAYNGGGWATLNKKIVA